SATWARSSSSAGRRRSATTRPSSTGGSTTPGWGSTGCEPGGGGLVFAVLGAGGGLGRRLVHLLGPVRRREDGAGVGDLHLGGVLDVELGVPLAELHERAVVVRQRR